MTTPISVARQGGFEDDSLFARIATDIEIKGFSINPAALPHELGDSLSAYAHQLHAAKFERAGIGRADDFFKNSFVRSDEICWITGESLTGQAWLTWCLRLQRFLNRRLFLGLFSFESHFAHYKPGDFYKRHFDAFRGEANRVLSVVVYLNPAWGPDDGGELVLYSEDSDTQGVKVTPLQGTVVVFLSEEFPHEVLPAHRDRYSIAGWYRVNTSHATKVDPPR
ncbi:SM-20-related protein [Alteromonadaceae bacterium 2753L.S.0a.02]|nr:SM-20-related protein [Alteromonadaceae bacterium 2753L.S.0a.02]